MVGLGRQPAIIEDDGSLAGVLSRSSLSHIVVPGIKIRRESLWLVGRMSLLDIIDSAGLMAEDELEHQACRVTTRR